MTIRIRIRKLCLNGFGIGYHEGKTVFVPNAIPGDLIEVEVTQTKTAILYAQPKAICEPAPQRISPECEAFAHPGHCGGCDWLMLPYAEQLRVKHELFAEVIVQSGFRCPIPDVSPSPTRRHYRNRSYLPVTQTDKGITFGMYERWSHRVVPHQTCQLHPPLFDEIGRAVMAWAEKAKVKPYNELTHTGDLRHLGFRISTEDGSVLLILVTRTARLPFSNLLIKSLCDRFPQITGIIRNINRQPGNTILGREDKLLWGKDYLHDRILNISLRVHYRSFLQVNGGSAARMYEHIGSLIGRNDTVIDAYCGIGSITLTVAGSANQVTGIEEVAEAVDDARINATANHITNASFLCATVADALPALIRSKRFNTIIFDPPRKGLEPGIIESIDPTQITRIIYVSCQPMTLIRDLKLLRERGYELQQIRLFDMFPQTWHTEAVALLHSGRLQP
ncbi:MAG: 23S rRNA (uracil(1939)-C(5))-methyltransferase RlmD [Candidatus Cloacimonetes bacterium]|nr:23S rRNA (uracil(1939)-C(5))-methyltransferase RlmD [Candidatus Cloacimonadota bacterium]